MTSRTAVLCVISCIMCCVLRASGHVQPACLEVSWDGAVRCCLECEGCPQSLPCHPKLLRRETRGYKSICPIMVINGIYLCCDKDGSPGCRCSRNVTNACNFKEGFYLRFKYFYNNKVY